MTIEEIEKIPMIFIVGVGRSGTTLLRTMMDTSSEAIFPPESRLIIHLKKKYIHKTNWSIHLVDEFLEDLYKEKKFVYGWQVDRQKLRAYILSFPLEKIRFRTLVKMIYISFSSNFEKDKIKLIGDKNPAYSMFVEELIEVFPAAKFIHIVRDYRDNILSRKKITLRQNVANLAVWWRFCNTLIERSKKENPEKFYTLRYVDLVEDPENKMRKIFTYSRLKFDRNVLRYHENLEEKLDDQNLDIIKAIHPNLFNEINTNSVGKWKNELSQSELDVITYILGDYGKTYNYEPYEDFSGKKYRFKAIIGFLISFKDICTTKGYFLLPIIIRDFLRKVSDFLFKKFGYYNVHNFSNYIVEIKNDQAQDQ